MSHVNNDSWRTRSQTTVSPNEAKAWKLTDINQLTAQADKLCSVM